MTSLFQYAPSNTTTKLGTLSTTSRAIYTPSSPYTTTTSNPISSTSPASVAPTSLRSHHKNTRLSNGAVAGIAIGSAIVGALVAAVASFILMKRRSRKKEHHTGAPGVTTVPRGQTSGSYQPSSAQKSVQHTEKALTPLEVDHILPQPFDDGSMKQEVEKFFAFVGDHVDPSLYHDYPLESHVLEQRLASESSTDIPPGIASQHDIDIGKLLANPSTRYSAVTSFISAKMLAAIEFTAEPERSLLPSVVPSFLRSSSLASDNSRGKCFRVSGFTVVDQRQHPNFRCHDGALPLLISWDRRGIEKTWLTLIALSKGSFMN